MAQRKKAMRGHDVHIFAVVRVKVPKIKARDHRQAIEKAETVVDLYQLFDRDKPCPGVEHTEYAEEISHYLVDEENDPTFERSEFYKADGVTRDDSEKGTKSATTRSSGTRYHLANGEDPNEQITFRVKRGATNEEIFAAALETLGWGVYGGPGNDE